MNLCFGFFIYCTSTIAAWAKVGAYEFIQYILKHVKQEKLKETQSHFLIHVAAKYSIMEQCGFGLHYRPKPWGQTSYILHSFFFMILAKM